MMQSSRNAIFRTLLAGVLWLWPAAAPAEPARSTDFDIIFVTEDRLMQKAIEEAQSTLEQDFFGRISQPEGAHSFMLKVVVPIGDGREEHVWLGAIRTIGSDRGAGKLDKAPKWFGARAGMILLFHMKEVADWRYMLDGKMHGARTTRVLLPRLDPERAEELRKLLAPL